MSEVLQVNYDLHIPAPPAEHLEHPKWWLVVDHDGVRIARVPDVTAMSVVDGWLVLWRYGVAVGTFSPDTNWRYAYAAQPVWRQYNY